MKDNKESVFTSICSYIPHPGINPIENFLTELLAWMINNIEGFGVDYVKYLIDYGKLNVDSNQIIEVESKTQVHVSPGFIDMVIDTNIGVSFICEHKVDSWLSDNQILKYMESCSELGSNDYYSVLLTKSNSQHTQDANIRLLWRGIDKLINEIINKYEYEERFMLSQFSAFLKEKGLGVQKMIKANVVETYIWDTKNAKEFEDSLEMIFRELAEYGWNNDYPSLNKFSETQYEPSYVSRYGRSGIAFFGGNVANDANYWKPGLFAGVILDGEDHGLEPSIDIKGPDFVVLIDTCYKRDEEKHHELLKRFEPVIIRIKKDMGSFSKFEDRPGNHYRIAILRKPFYDVIKDSKTVEEQKESIKQAISEGLKLFLGE